MKKVYYISTEHKIGDLCRRVSRLERMVSQYRWLTLILSLDVLMLGISLIISNL